MKKFLFIFIPVFTSTVLVHVASNEINGINRFTRNGWSNLWVETVLVVVLSLLGYYLLSRIFGKP